LGFMNMVKKVKLIFTPFLFLLAMGGCSEQRKVDIKPSQPTSAQQFLMHPPINNSSMGVSQSNYATEPNAVISLRDALALALTNNPELSAYSWEIRAAEARKLQASLLPNPEVELEFEEVGRTGKRSGFDGAEATLVLSQLVELGGKRDKRMQVATLAKRATEWDYEVKRLDVLTRVKKAFVNVLARQKHLELVEELARLSETVLNTVSQRVEAGKDTPLEKTKAEVVYAVAQIELKKAYKNLDSARISLASTWAGKTAVFERAVGEYEKISPIPPPHKLAHLLDQNPDITRWGDEIAKHQAALQLEEAKAISDPSVFGGVQRFNEDDDTAMVFGFSMPLPIFDRNQAGVREARYRLAKAREEQQAEAIRVNAVMMEAYARLFNAFTEVEGLKNEILPRAGQVFEAATESYREGKLNYLNVLDAQRTLFEAKGQYIEALADYHNAQADMERLTGQGPDSIDHNGKSKKKEQTQ
jgi:cobalt-zinc-cadmium efflux system outer membrane protein